MVTLLNAIDYWVAGSLDSFYFHLSIFATYLLQLVLMFFMFRNIFDDALQHVRNAWIALLAVAFYGLHAANAETINYISARSDSFSTLCIVAGLLMYQVGSTRKYFLYLIPVVVGILTKQTGAMFAPLLLLYIALFEEKVFVRGEADSFAVNGIWRVARKAAPAFVVCVGVLVFNQLLMTPQSTVSFNAGAGRFEYLQTQIRRHGALRRELSRPSRLER